MKYRIKILVVIAVMQLINGCNSDSGTECFRTLGTAMVYDVPVENFTTIHISAGIELVVTQGMEQKVTVQTGENIVEYITAQVTNGELRLTNANNCNWVRDYNSTTVYVTTPHLEKIYSASQFGVKSQGVLSFPSLQLQSGITGETASGTFNLNVNCENLVVEDNQAAYFVLTGAVNSLTVNFYSGDSRFDGAGLLAQGVNVFHRSSNDIIVNPQQSVTGTLYSTGNLVLKNTPPVIDVQQVYTGSIIYN